MSFLCGAMFVFCGLYYSCSTPHAVGIVVLCIRIFAAPFLAASALLSASILVLGWPAMPGHFVACYAWPGGLPRCLWPSDLIERSVREFHSALLPQSVAGPDGRWLYGHFYAQSTPRQDLRYYDVFFSPEAVPLPIKFDVLLAINPGRIASVVVGNRPVFWLGPLCELGHLFQVEFTDFDIRRGGRAIPVWAPISDAYFIRDARGRAERALAMQQPEPPRYLPAPWWCAPPMAMDAILLGNYYELFFMRDYGTSAGPCVALYGTTRRLSGGYGHGNFFKFELLDVPFNDPGLWFKTMQVGFVGYVGMPEWATDAIVRSRL